MQNGEQDKDLGQWVPAPMRGGPAPPDPEPVPSPEPRPESTPVIGTTESSGGAAPPVPAATDPRVADLEAAVRETEERLSLADRQLAAIGDRLAAASDRLKSLEQNSEGSAAALDGIGAAQSSAGARHAKLAGRVDAMDGQVAAIGNRVATITDRLDAIAERIEPLTKDAAEQREARRRQTAQLDQHIGELEERLRVFEREAAARADREDDRFTGIERMATGLEEKVSIVLDEFRERLHIQSERLSESDQSAREHLEVIERGFEAAIAGLRLELDERVQRADAMQKEIDTLSEALTVKLGELGARISGLADGGRPTREQAPRKPDPTLPRSAVEAAVSKPSSLDDATFEELRALGLSVTQAARLIGYRASLATPFSASDLDEVPGLQGEMRERLRALLD